MVYCTTCGTQIKAGSFCANCGTAAAPAPSSAPAFQQAAPTNTLAIVALVTSLVGIHLAGIICGHIALNQIKSSGESGRGMALAGLIIGYVGVGAVILFCVFWVAAIASISGGMASA